MSKRRKTRPRVSRGSSSSWGPVGWLLGAAVAVVVAAGAWFLLDGSGGGSETSSGITFPSYVRTASADTKKAYTYAVEHRDMLQYIPCFCGCGEHSGHKNVWNCFVQSMSGSSVAFDEHGAGCDMCVYIALDVKGMVEGGKGLREARQVIEARYGSLGPATNTPWPQ